MGEPRPDTPTAAAEEEVARRWGVSDAWEEYHSALWGVRRSVRYHDRREFFFARMARLSTGLSLVAGSATIGGAIKGIEWIAVLAGCVVTLVSIISLVTGAGDQARKHADLKRRFCDLEARMIGGHASEENIAAWKAERIRIEGDEPPQLHNLDRLCHNELVRAEGRGSPVAVSWAGNITANWLSGPETAPPAKK